MAMLWIHIYVLFWSAMVSKKEVEKFFEHFSKTVEGVPAYKFWNLDKTNFKDDTGSEKALFRKGTMYAESTRTSSSRLWLSFCEFAKGATRPLYIVSKAMNLYDSWTGAAGKKGHASSPQKVARLTPASSMTGLKSGLSHPKEGAWQEGDCLRPPDLTHQREFHRPL